MFTHLLKPKICLPTCINSHKLILELLSHTTEKKEYWTSVFVYSFNFSFFCVKLKYIEIQKS